LTRPRPGVRHRHPFGGGAQQYDPIDHHHRIGSLPVQDRVVLGSQQLAQHIVENTMLNGETIRLDGAIRMQPK